VEEATGRRADLAWFVLNIGGHCTRVVSLDPLDHGPSPGPDRTVRTDEHQIGKDLYLHDRLPGTRGTFARHQGSPVSLRILRRHFRGRATSRYGDLLGRRKRGCVGGGLGASTSLHHAQEVDGNEHQHAGQEQHGSGQDGDRSGFGGPPGNGPHPVSCRMTAVPLRSTEAGNSHVTSGMSTGAW
jgi:hypothetical protein